MYKAAIFDLDGTILDTVASIARSANEVMKQLGYRELPEEDFKYYAGDGQKELLRRCLRASGDTECRDFEKAFELYQTSLGKHCMYKVEPYPGIRKLLADLKAREIKISILSNKPHVSTVQVIEDVFGKGYFDHIQGQQEAIARKPDPTGALHIARHFGLTAAECLYIGDTNTDMQTGNSAGMDTVGVLWGFRDRKELEENNAGLIVEHPDEIREKIDD